MLGKKLFISMLSSATWEVAKERPEWDLNPDLCNTSVVLNQLSYQANWELLIMWVYDKPWL